VFKSAREPTPRHQTGQFQQVKPGMRPDVLRLDDKTRAHGRPIEPNICQAVDLALAAGDEAAAETERAMEFARMANNANASRIERGCDIIAEPRLYRTSVPPYYDWLGSPFAGFHHPPRFDPCYNDRNSYDDCKFVEVGDLQRSVRSSRFPIIGSRNSKGAAGFAISAARCLPGFWRGGTGRSALDAHPEVSRVVALSPAAVGRASL
jgi:hypothetical protein